MTCSTSFTSPTSPTSPSSPASPPIQRAAEQGRDRRHVRAASGDARLEALAEKPIRPYMEGVPKQRLHSSERSIRNRINIQLLPRTTELVEVCKQLENGNAPEYSEAMNLQKQLEKRSRGMLVDEHDKPIGGGDELAEAVDQLEKAVNAYFDRNPGTPRPILRPRLPAADVPVQSNQPSVPAFLPKEAIVRRRGSHAQIDEDIMAAALHLVKVDSQTSSAMENPENVLNTKVGNFLEAIRQDKSVNMMAVIEAKENRGNSKRLVNALKNLIRRLPDLPM
ncbi:hypothetical protein [Xanthomonas graminis]|uniref:hypothetical protein n=1 Tax=Xanthomonas graminis TaxID=3390026 RepID=UPI0021B10E61|nr:hypothetical protein [Xanthomonas translucens]